MKNLYQPEAVATVNEQSLDRLLRSIMLSQGQFSLILVRCNYSWLQQQMIQQSQERSRLPIRLLDLPQSVKTLYGSITVEIEEKTPEALMIVGLDTVEELNLLLRSTNQVRDEFRKEFSFPLVLWVTDTVATQLIRLAPDFKSWAAVTIKFEAGNSELIDYLKRRAKTQFTLAELKIQNWSSQILSSVTPQRLSSKSDETRIPTRCRELELAWKDLQKRGYEFDSELEAGRQFILAQDFDVRDQSDRAREHYQYSLSFLQREASQKGYRAAPDSLSFNLTSSSTTALTINSTSSKPQSLLLQQAIVLFYLALTYCLQAARHPAKSRQLLQHAQQNFQQSQHFFETIGRPDLKAGVVSHLADVLKRLQKWDELQLAAQEGLRMHLLYGTSHQLAQDYGFMAEVALQERHWQHAHELAKLALAILPHSEGTACHSPYLLLLARTHQHRGELTQAIEQLELARTQTQPKYDPRLYIDILAELRSLYYQQGQYLKAFRIKKHQREIEHQYGYRAFIGAAQLSAPKQVVNPSSCQGTEPATIADEMIASCRQQDIQNLLQRLSRDDHKLIVIHGRSGVGKSSLVNAGLVPALQTTSLGARQPLPVVIRSYSAWVRELERSLATALLSQLHLNSKERNLKKIWYQVVATASHKSHLKHSQSPDDCILHPSSFVLQQLRKNADRNFLTVLIFDQFEEFFFASSNRHHRQQFYQVLKNILNIPFVKIVFSLREDYLHYLLEWDHIVELDAINNNILDKQIRYRLRDFSPSEAKLVIERLTQRAKFELEPALIDAVVKDLADERQEVRPIELQVVGAQLQEENGQGITTLAQYQQLGNDPKTELIKHSIEQVIQDCGSENEAGAWEVLFALTDENLTRPIRTKAELIKSIHRSENAYNAFPETARLLLDPSPAESFIDIILESGLLLRRREDPEDRYQLLHDYLVAPIRQRYAILEKQRQQEIQHRLHQAEAEKQQVEAALEKMSREQLLQRNRRLKLLLCLSLTVAGLLGSAAKIAKYQQHRADEQKRLADMATLTASSDALFFSHYKFDALMEGLRAAKQLQGLKFSTLSNAELNNMETRIAATLQQSVYGIHEKNRLEGHGDIVWDVSFSPKGNLIASASVDKTIKLWTPNGKLIQTLKGHLGHISSISFSPDGQLLASASQDGTIKLWNLEAGAASDSTLTLTGHQNIVSAVSFSPDGNLIASASEDQTIKLWNRHGVLIRSLNIHQAPIKWISFSPQGNLLATASDDGTVRILDLQGQIRATLNHSNYLSSKVYMVAFSPDGEYLATAGEDKTVKLWSRRGRLLHILEGHTQVVFGVKFSPDSRMLATAGEDKTIKLWSVKGDLLKTFQGHGDKVTSVSFSPDGKTLASSSYDKTVKLWSLDPITLPTIKGHQHRVLSVSFSPDGQLLASTSQDQTVRLWSRDGTEFATLPEHQERVSSVSFSPNGQFLASVGYDKRLVIWKFSQHSKKTLDFKHWVSFPTSHQTQPSSSMPFQQKHLLGLTPSQDGNSEVSAAPTRFKSWIAHDDNIMKVSFSPDSQLIATASKDQTVKIWDLQGNLLHTLTGHQGWVNSVAFSPDGQILASASDDGTVKLWSRTGKRLRTIQAHESFVLDVSFSPDNQVIATAGYDNTVKLWSRDGILLNTLLKGSSDSVTSLAFSPDSQLIASASYDGSVKLWSRQDGTLLKTLMGHHESVMGISFSPDGKILASASRDKTLILWNLDLEDLMVEACQWVGNYLETNPYVKSSDRKLCD